MQSQIAFSRNVSLCFYRVAQEAFNNIVKHSNANTAQLTLDEKPGLLRMNIQNAGVGFSVGDTSVGSWLVRHGRALSEPGGADYSSNQSRV
jgi:signal transduction histidine kinase